MPTQQMPEVIEQWLDGAITNCEVAEVFTKYALKETKSPEADEMLKAALQLIQAANDNYLRLNQKR
jgi:anthranilate phosphoribosyltransferase